MNEKILIVEDEFIVANDLRLTLEKADYTVSGIAESVDEAQEILKKENPSLVLLDIHLKGKLNGIDLAKQLNQSDIPFVYLSSNSNQRILEEAKTTGPYGFLVKPFREKDLLVTLDIARYRHKNSLESKLRKEKQLQELLNKIGNESLDWQNKLLKVAVAMQSCVPFDYMTVTIKSKEEQPFTWCSFFRIGFDQYQLIAMDELSVISKLNTEELGKLQSATSIDSKAAYYNTPNFIKMFRQHPLREILVKTFDVNSLLVLPLFFADGNTFEWCFYCRKNHNYNEELLAFLYHFQESLFIVAQSILLKDKNNTPAESLTPRQNTHRHHVDVVSNFNGIIGSSPQLLYVLDLVTQVGPVDTSVLIMGESGTGKEKIARCIHDLSSRKTKPFIVVNCAALPATLIDSELFGHEKGAFTGATDKRIGKFEQADDGTIFLDEIGELSLEVQVKLLRVLQEKEIERVGGKITQKINVRFIAATNRNLEKEVAEGRFRLDLYYRLNVFPIVIPPLKERREDIEQLAYYFAEGCSNRIKKKFNGISKQMMGELEAYNWIGNIRELENIVEQSVILNDGKSELTLRQPLRNTVFAEGGMTPASEQNTSFKSLTDIKNLQQQSERYYIISVLKKVKGRIRGKGGAAEILNLKPTTLESKMIKLGIKKDYSD